MNRVERRLSSPSSAYLVQQVGQVILPSTPFVLSFFWFLAFLVSLKGSRNLTVTCWRGATGTGTDFFSGRLSGVWSWMEAVELSRGRQS